MGLYESFRDPSSEFRQAPFWFWNHRLDRETLDWQIDQMAEKGLGGFVMHARHGLITPYLSDEWFDCIRFGCEKARELGMVAWAYDERDWPSGPAGGEVIANHANRLNYLKLSTEEVDGPCTIDLGSDVVCVYVSKEGEGQKRVEPDRSLELGEGKWRVAKAFRFESPAILWFESYLDTLNESACRDFIRSTYDKHVQKLGDLRRLGLTGFFTDEPALSTYPDDLGRIPWTPTLPEAFEALKGYDLLDYLPDLFSETDMGPQVRYDYWDVACRMFEKAFFEAIEGWCDQRGVKLIGHPLGEEPLFFQFRCLGNIFYYLKHFHMPGLDHLTCHVGKGGAGAMSPKMVASAALLAGRERTMTETFGESGWGLTLREMKWMTDWQIAHGINYFIPHAFYYSVSMRRKKDSPPSEFYQAPYWPYYRHFADYSARLTAAMTGGEHGAKVAVLYPMSSVWADFVPGGENCGLDELEQSFAPLGEALLRIHRDFVVVDEASFAGAKVEGRKFKVNGLTFEALIVPKMTAVHEDALAALTRVAESCVVAAMPVGLLRVLRPASPDVIEAEPQRIDLAEIRGVRPLASGGEEDLRAALAEVTPEVTVDGAPDVYYLHRRKDGLALYFLANTSHEPVKAVFSFETVGRAEIWDAETGERHRAPGQKAVEGRLGIPIELAPVGSCLVVVDPSQPVAHAPEAHFRAGKRIKLCGPGASSDLWSFNPENGSFYALRDWQLHTTNQHHVTELCYRTQFVMPERLGNLRLILDGIPRKAAGLPEGARPIMSHETDAIVLLDGKELKDDLPWEIDPEFHALDLRGKCEPGTHEIIIVIKNNGWFPQPPLGEYAWLAGDFQVDSRGDMPCLIPIRGIKTGPWEDQGHPYFSGTACYYADLHLEGDLYGRRVFLDAGRVGHLLDVEVNAQPAGVRAWPPYRVEITGLVKPGWNQFMLRVTNSARNFFEGPDRSRPSGLLEDVWIEIEA